jgi:hypothetical protein
LDNRSVDIQSFYKTTVFTRRLPDKQRIGCRDSNGHHGRITKAIITDPTISKYRAGVRESTA